MNADLNKRRKRIKTRGERNQLLKSSQDQEKQDSSNKGKKRSKAKGNSQRSTYTLQAGKGTCLPLFPKSYKKDTKGTITQGRLILQNVGIANAKVCEWATRESEDVSKKVDAEMKKIFSTVSEEKKTRSMTATASETFSKKSVDYLQSPDSPGDEAMCVDLEDKSSPQVVEMTEKKQTSNKTTSASSELRTAKSQHGFFTDDSSDAAEQLSPNPNIKSIADSILKELKPKFTEMFPQRGLKEETHAEIRNLLIQSGNVPSAALFNHRKVNEPVLHTKKGRTYKHDSMTITPPRETILMPATNRHNLNQGSMLETESSIEPASTNPPEGGVPGPPKKSTSTNGVFKVRLVEHISTDESEGEQDGGLSKARYSAFKAHSRQISAHRQKQLWREQQGLYRIHQAGGQRVSRSWPDQACQAMAHLGGRPGSWDSDLACGGRHHRRALLFTDPPKWTDNRSCYSLSCPPLHSRPSTTTATVTAPNSRQCLCFPPPSSIPGLCDQRPLSQQPESSLFEGGCLVSDRLTRSRHNLRAALDSACSKAPCRIPRASCQPWMASLHSEMEVGDLSPEFPTSVLDREPSFLRDTSSHHGYWHLSELRTHQADLQRQARDFLDDVAELHGEPIPPRVGPDCVGVDMPYSHMFGGVMDSPVLSPSDSAMKMSHPSRFKDLAL